MELLGQQLINASRQKVWNALNDPDVLIRCIPGCEEISRVSDNQLQVRMMVKMGPVRSRFAGTLSLEDINAPESCSLVFDGTGAAGFAKGGAKVSLADQDATQTRLNYTAKASVGGKLGQIGGRLIESSARKMSDEFFSAFQSVVSEDSHAKDAVRSGEDDEATLPASGPVGSSPISPPFKNAAVPAQAAASSASAVSKLQSSSTKGYGGWRPELYRAFWFCLGVFFTLLVGRWLP